MDSADAAHAGRILQPPAEGFDLILHQGLMYTRVWAENALPSWKRLSSRAQRTTCGVCRRNAQLLQPAKM